MKASDLIDTALVLLQQQPEMNTFQALMVSRDDPSDAALLVESMTLLLTNANIDASKMTGPDMADAVVAWDRAQRVVSLVQPLQATAATALTAEAAQPVTVGAKSP